MNSDIAREVTLLLATRERTRATGWSWRKGVILFPEVKCPYCSEIVRSKAIWVVQGNYLTGQAVPVSGKMLKLDPPKHPHATPSAICMGSATESLQALFNGLNPDSAYCDVDTWLKGKYWEHYCEAMDRKEEDHDQEFFCDGCEEYFEDDELNTFNNCYYCNNCFNELAFCCDYCGENFSRGSMYTAFSYFLCATCFNEKFLYCTSCSEVTSKDDCENHSNCISYWEI